MTPKIMLAFYDVHMGASHASLGLLLEKKTKWPTPKRGECAVFVNKKWTAAKILTGQGSILYWRSPSGTAISMEELRYLPTHLGGAKFSFDGSLESRMIKEGDNFLSKLTKTLKPVRSA